MNGCKQFEVKTPIADYSKSVCVDTKQNGTKTVKECQKIEIKAPGTGYSGSHQTCVTKTGNQPPSKTDKVCLSQSKGVTVGGAGAQMKGNGCVQVKDGVPSVEVSGDGKVSGFFASGKGTVSVTIDPQGVSVKEQLSVCVGAGGESSKYGGRVDPLCKEIKSEQKLIDFSPKEKLAPQETPAPHQEPGLIKPLGSINIWPWHDHATEGGSAWDAIITQDGVITGFDGHTALCIS